MNTLQKLVFGASITVAVLGILWPYLPWTQDTSQESKCPLGYTTADNLAASKLPAGHPAVGNTPQHTPTGTLFYNAHIITIDQEVPSAVAFSVDATGSIQELFQRQPDLKKFKDVVNLNKSTVVPGFVDAHVHLIPAGLALSTVQLQGVASRDDFIAIVAEAAKKLHSQPAAEPTSAAEIIEDVDDLDDDVGKELDDDVGKERVRGARQGPQGGVQWLTGGGWDDNMIGGQLPSAQWIDEVTGNIPTMLTRMDGHMAVVNTAALRLAAISVATADPEAGSVDRDSSGQPTGILREEAMKLVTSLLPEPSKQQLHEALQAASQYLLSKGITTVGDVGRWPFNPDVQSSWRDLEEIYTKAAEASQLPVRVKSYVPLRTWQHAAFKHQLEGYSHSGHRLHWGGVKQFADGSLGSRSALFWEPYHDDTSSSGSRSADLESIKSDAQVAASEGLQIAVHAIGDRAVDDVCGVYHTLRPVQMYPGGPICHHRIEHVQHVAGPATTQKLGQQGTWAVVNPLHLLSDKAMMLERLGKGRAGRGRAFAYASMQKAGVKMAFGSDWPVVAADALLGIYVAAFRKSPGKNEGAWVPEETLSLEAALHAHTVGAAGSVCLDYLVGAIRPGLRADFAVLSTSPLKMKEGSQLPQVLATWVDGRCAWGYCNNGGSL